MNNALQGLVRLDTPTKNCSLPPKIAEVSPLSSHASDVKITHLACISYGVNEVVTSRTGADVEVAGA